MEESRVMSGEEVGSPLAARRSPLAARRSPLNNTRLRPSQRSGVARGTLSPIIPRVCEPLSWHRFDVLDTRWPMMGQGLGGQGFPFCRWTHVRSRAFVDVGDPVRCVYRGSGRGRRNGMASSPGAADEVLEIARSEYGPGVGHLTARPGLCFAGRRCRMTGSGQSCKSDPLSCRVHDVDRTPPGRGGRPHAPPMPISAILPVNRPVLN